MNTKTCVLSLIAISAMIHCQSCTHIILIFPTIPTPLATMACVLFIARTHAQTMHLTIDGSWDHNGDNRYQECHDNSDTQGFCNPELESALAVRCCENGEVGSTVISKTATYPCLSGVTWDAAVSRCTAMGYQLCTQAQLLAFNPTNGKGYGTGTGCDFDRHHVWTADPCTSNKPSLYRYDDTLCDAGLPTFGCDRYRSCYDDNDALNAVGHISCDAESACGLSTISSGGTTYCRGLFACKGASIIAGDEIHCSGDQACGNSVLSAVKIVCNGAESCQDSSIVAAYSVLALGDSSCKSSDITTQYSIVCYGYLSCNSAHLSSNYVGLMGYISALSATIDSGSFSSMDVECKGFMAGYADIICRSGSTCSLTCVGWCCMYPTYICESGATCTTDCTDAGTRVDTGEFLCPDITYVSSAMSVADKTHKMKKLPAFDIDDIEKIAFLPQNGKNIGNHNFYRFGGDHMLSNQNFIKYALLYTAVVVLLCLNAVCIFVKCTKYKFVLIREAI